MIQPFLLSFFLCSTLSATSSADITESSLLSRIKTLASDEYEGRLPGTKGEGLTTQYLISELNKMGVLPGNPNGAYEQAVPLVGIRSQYEFTLSVNQKQYRLVPNQQVIAITHQQTQEVKVENSELVFVGYGVVAPEYQWDDYKGSDLKGKTLVMLINDPPIPDPKDPAKLDVNYFKGKAMTYYGRWNYKYEIAKKMGAKAAIIVHETKEAGYSFEVLSGSLSRENFDIESKETATRALMADAWITREQAEILFKNCGKDFSQLKKESLSRSFKPVPLHASLSVHFTNQLRSIKSKNIIGKIEGSDSTLKNQYIVYSAHWDHLGKDPSLKGKQIYHGALDNASGVAAVLEIAQAIKNSPEKPKRSFLFFFPTAEEQGCLGSRYYGENPLYPLAQTLADINLDISLNPWGKTHDLQIIGYENTTLEDSLKTVAKTEKKVLVPEAAPENGMFYRSDQFEFAKRGVPSLFLGAGEDLVEKGSGFGAKKRIDYIQNHYHKVTDEVQADWDLRGAVQDLKILTALGFFISKDEKIPEWKSGTEFKAVRAK